MGYWRTLHLFDDQKFQDEVVPVLKGEQGDLATEYHEFLKLNHTGGIAHIPKASVIAMVDQGTKSIMELANLLTKTFKNHRLYPRYEDLIVHLKNLEGHYEFCRFFEQYVFKTCADLFPATRAKRAITCGSTKSEASKKPKVVYKAEGRLKENERSEFSSISPGRLPAT